MKPTDCPFCKILENPNEEAIVYESDLALGFMAARQINLGEVLVIPKRHVEDISNLTEDELMEIMKISRTIESAVRRAFNADGSMLYVLNGAVQHIRHLHIHIIPRHKGDKYTEKLAKDRNYTCPVKDRKAYAKRIIRELRIQN